MKNQKDPTFLGLASALFLTISTIVFSVLEDPPVYVVGTLLICMIGSACLLIWAICEYFQPSKKPPLPITIDSSLRQSANMSFSGGVPLNSTLWKAGVTSSSPIEVNVEVRMFEIICSEHNNIIERHYQKANAVQFGQTGLELVDLFRIVAMRGDDKFAFAPENVGAESSAVLDKSRKYEIHTYFTHSDFNLTKLKHYLVFRDNNMPPLVTSIKPDGWPEIKDGKGIMF